MTAEDAEAHQGATTNALAQAAMKLGEAIYAAQQGAGGGGDGPAPARQAERAAGDDNVVDADFEEVKDDKKKSA